MSFAARLTALLALLATIGCARKLPGSYTCTSSSQCIYMGVNGICEPTGACSFPDASCPSGRRYGDLDPTGLAGSCVPVAIAGDLGTPPASMLDMSTVMTGGGMITSVGTARAAPGTPSGGGVAVSVPGNAMAGDFFFAAVYSSDNTSAIAAPSGWTQHADLPGTDFHAAWFWHLAGGSEPSAVKFTIGGAPNVVAAALIAYRGVSPANPIDVSTSSTITATEYLAPSITTTHANDRLLAMFVDRTQSGLLNAPAGMTTAVADNAIVFFDGTQASAGATGNKLASNVPGVGAVDYVALTPAP